MTPIIVEVVSNPKFASKSERGMWLGLYISESIVEAYRARMWAGNARSSNGAKVSIALPILDGRAAE